MLKFLEEAITNTFDVAEATIFGEGPSKRQVAKLLADGLSVVAIATLLGASIELVEELVE